MDRDDIIRIAQEAGFETAQIDLVRRFAAVLGDFAALVAVAKKRPNRNQLWGMSPSQFKTMLKRKGYKVGRDFFKQAAVAHKNNRAYRFRYWSFPEFFVDVSCPLNEFDRWANSTDRVLTFANWIES